MNPLLSALSQANPPATMLGVGVLVVIIAVFASLVLFRAHRTAVARLVDLIMTGQAHEARIRARAGGAAVKPILAALSSEPGRPKKRSPAMDVALVALCVAPALLLPLHGLNEIRTAAPDQVVPLTAWVMITFVVMLPTSLVGALVIIHIGVRNARTLRAACVNILARQVHAVVEGDLRNTAPPGARSATDGATDATTELDSEVLR